MSEQQTFRNTPTERISRCSAVPVYPPVEGTTELPVNPGHWYLTGIAQPHPENLIKTTVLKRLLNRQNFSVFMQLDYYSE